MLYGDEKVKSIARSVLPASSRSAKSARARKRGWNQHTRHRLDAEIDEFFHPGMTAAEVEEAYLDAGNPYVDAVNPSERHEMTRIRNKRRLADNLGSLTRWTASQIDDFETRDDLLEHVARLLPSDLAGRHALSHMVFEFGDRPRYFRYREDAEPDEVRAIRYALWEHMLTVVFEGDHAGLNREVKRHVDRSVRCRTRGCGEWEVERTRTTYKSDRTYLRKTWKQSTIWARDLNVETVTCSVCGNESPNTCLPVVKGACDLPRFMRRLCNDYGSGVKPVRRWIAQRYETIMRKAAA